jgi:hypothetical protein
MLQHLGETADRLQSSVLLTFATKVALQEDHFVKVRQLISDLIARLEQQALNEADSKSFCDEQMANAIESRDTNQMAIETQSAIIDQEQAFKAKLKKEIAELSKEIADLNKGLNEATELRAMEKADNEKTLADAEAGKLAVEEAVSTLKDFYNGALLQKSNTDRQPVVDREGKTVGDYAPELSYEGDYHGDLNKSKGIFGLLDVIVADFQRTLTTVTDQETAAQVSFEEFQVATTKSTESKQAYITEKEGLISNADVAITDAMDAKKSAEALHSIALSELEKLHSMCVGSEETHAERVQKREQEVAALKEALQILEEWKS